MRFCRGFNLVEMLVVITLLPVVMIITTQLFNIFVQETPRGNQIVQENTTLLHLLKQLRTDVENSQQIRIDSLTPGKPLTLQTSTGSWIYCLGDQSVTRRIVGSDSGSERSWHLPRAEVAWTLIEPHPGSIALEVTRSIRYTLRGKSQARLANAHLFFPSLSKQEVTP